MATLTIMGGETSPAAIKYHRKHGWSFARPEIAKYYKSIQVMHLEGKPHIFMLNLRKTAKALCQQEPWNKERDCVSVMTSHMWHTH